MPRKCNNAKCKRCGGTGEWQPEFADWPLPCYLPEESKPVGPAIVISEANDGFAILVDGKRYPFDQEDDKKKLVKVFKDLGFTNVTYEEDY